MFYSQFNQNLGTEPSKYRFSFVKYRTTEDDGVSKFSDSIRSLSERTRSKYMSFLLQVIYET